MIARTLPLITFWAQACLGLVLAYLILVFSRIGRD